MVIEDLNLPVRRRGQKLNRLIHILRLGAALVDGYKAGLLNAPVQLVDVGARGGLSRSWQLLWRAGMIRPTFVEPEPTEAVRLRGMYPNAKIIESALGEDAATRTLYVTREPGCSSLLLPEVSERAPEIFRRMCEVVNQVSVKVEPARSIFVAEGVAPEVLKLDVQGMELSILRGLGSMITDINVVEIELSFVRTYERQPLVQEVVEFMLDSGFGLLHISAFGVVGTGSAIQANALFGNKIKRDSRHLALESMALRALGAGYAY